MLEAALIPFVLSAGMVYERQAEEPRCLEIVEVAAPWFPSFLQYYLEDGEALEVVMELTVDPLGRPVRVEFVDGPLFALEYGRREILEKVARRWRFEPEGRYPPARKVDLFFRFRVMPIDTADEDLDPIFAGCSVEVRERGPLRHAENVPAPFRYLYGSIGLDEERSNRSNLPCHAIEYEELGWRTVFLRNGRTEKWFTREESPRKIGELNVFDYGRLCYLMHRVGFLEMRERYHPSGTDEIVTIIRLDLGPGGLHSVVDHGNQSPPEYWLLAKAMIALSREIEWSETREAHNE